MYILDLESILGLLKDYGRRWKYKEEKRRRRRS